MGRNLYKYSEAKRKGDLSKLVVRCLRENLPDFSELPDGAKGVAASKPGSTGNGFRGYGMLDYLSTVYEKYKVRVELIPLAPGQHFFRSVSEIVSPKVLL